MTPMGEPHITYEVERLDDRGFVDASATVDTLEQARAWAESRCRGGGSYRITEVTRRVVENPNGW